MPVSSTVADAATSSSSIDGTAAAAEPAPPHASGSKPARSVKRQCSSRVDGSGSAWYRSVSSALATLDPLRVPPMGDQDVAVRSAHEAHVADARVVDADHRGTRLPRFLDRRSDVGDAERDPGLVRGELLAVLLWVPEAERHVGGLDLTVRELAH